MGHSLVYRPAIADLSFQVYDRSIHPELIEPLVVRSFEQDGYRLRLMLTSAGHLLEYRRGDLTLVEILADQAHPLPESRQLFVHRIGGERTEQHWPSELVCYQTCFQVERLPEQLFINLSDELRNDGSTDGVLHQLQTSDRLGLSPITFVNLQARPGSVLVHSYHTFPEECAVVKIQSLIEVSTQPFAQPQ